MTLIRIAVSVLRAVNLVFKPMKLKNKVAIISRQSDVPTLDVEMLADALDRENTKTVILTKKLDKSPSGLLSYSIHLLKQMYHIGTSKVVVIDGYCIPVSILPHKKGQTIIQMWHALGAIKKFGWQNTDNPDGHSIEVSEAMCMHRNYDYILAPSEITGKFFSQAFRTPEEKIYYCGLPRIDFLRKTDEKMYDQISTVYGEIREKPVVLYVPTFRKDSAISMENLIESFDFSSFNLVIKKHFLDKGDYSGAREKGAIVDEQFSSMEWLRIADKVVTDYSAIAFEAAAIDKELYIYQPDIHLYENNVGLNINLQDEPIGHYVCSTGEELSALLSEPYDREKAEEFRKKYISVNTENCTGQLTGFITGFLK